MTRATRLPAPSVRILIDSFHPIIGGGERHAQLLAKELRARGLPVDVVTQRSLRSSPRHELVEGIPVVRLGLANLGRIGKYAMLPAVLVHLIRSHRRGEVIYVCGLRALGVVAVVAGALTGSPCVLRAEARTELSGEYAAGRKPGLTARTTGWLIKLRNRILLRATRFVSISRAITKEYLQEGVPPSRIVSIPNGVDVSLFAPPNLADRSALRVRLRLDRGSVVAYAGKLNHGKGLQRLLRAWQRLVPEVGDAQLVLIGSGDHQFLSCESELRSFVREHGLDEVVRLTGYVDDVQSYLQAADIFVFPSESEAFGLALVEAMACGVPVIASATGGILDIVEHGRTGWLVAVGDEEALVAAMRALLHDPESARALGRAGRQSVVERFAIERVVDAHEALFRSLSRQGTLVSVPGAVASG